PTRSDAAQNNPMKAPGMRSHLKGFQKAIYRKLGFRQDFLAANSVDKGNKNFKNGGKLFSAPLSLEVDL
ncbi:MAG TPA: hypothetical protein VNA27_02665, partial [Rubrobacteraceae bacterium]|nr:hypothetical protein [Rubrobacteraceae bacterium]